jgi:hypothetical protein
MSTKTKARILTFTFRGETYKVNERGEIMANGLPGHSREWIFLGGSRHHWRRGIDVTLRDAFTDPALLNGCLGWDIDHGTTRQWLGQYAGGLPRIYYASVSTN